MESSGKKMKNSFLIREKFSKKEKEEEKISSTALRKIIVNNLCELLALKKAFSC
jgi:hypothetical protein